MERLDDKSSRQNTGQSSADREKKKRLESYAVLGYYARYMVHEQRSQFVRLAMHLSRLFRDPDQKEKVQLIRDATAIVESIRDQQTDFMSLFNIEPKQSQAVVKLGEAVRFALEMATNWGRSADIQISIHVPEYLNQIEVPEPHVHLILENLLSNAMSAVKSMPLRDKRITVSARMAEKQIELAVQDNGPGIPPEIRGVIWEPGFSTKLDCLGMGLAVVKYLAEHCGGRAWETSGPGSTFYITIPVKTGDTQQ